MTNKVVSKTKLCIVVWSGLWTEMAQSDDVDISVRCKQSNVVCVKRCVYFLRWTEQVIEES